MTNLEINFTNLRLVRKIFCDRELDKIDKLNKFESFIKLFLVRSLRKLISWKIFVFLKKIISFRNLTKFENYFHFHKQIVFDKMKLISSTNFDFLKKITSGKKLQKLNKF